MPMLWSVVSTESRRVAVEHHAKFVSTATVFFQSHGIPMPTSAASSVEQHLTRRWMSEGWAGEHRVEILGVPFDATGTSSLVVFYAACFVFWKIGLTLKT